MLTTPKQITRALDRVLHKVEMPARYTGGELNTIVKDWSDPAIRTKIALAFPDIYELGGSNLGLMVLYDLINRRDDMLAERVYCPWTDFEAIMRRDEHPPLQPGDAPSAGRLRHRRLQPALRTALHQRADHARPGRHSAARRRPHRRPSADHRRRLRLLSTRSP